MNNRFAHIKEIFKPIFPMLLVLVGAFGTIYCFGTGAGGRLLIAIFLFLILAGVSIFAMEETRKNEFFVRKYGDKSQKKSKRRKRMGKRCPQCEKMLYHRRTTCQHCGYEFPSKKYKQEKAKKEQPKEKEARA